MAAVMPKHIYVVGIYKEEEEEEEKINMVPFSNADNGQSIRRRKLHDPLWLTHKLSLSLRRVHCIGGGVLAHG